MSIKVTMSQYMCFSDDVCFMISLRNDRIVTAVDKKLSKCIP